MKVGIVAGSYRPSRCGVADYTARLRRELQARDVDTLVYTDHKSAMQANDPAVQGVVKDWEWQHMPALASALRRAPVDLLHIQHAAGTYGFKRGLFLLPPVLRLTGAQMPVVTTVHEYGWWEWGLPGMLNLPMEWLKEWGQKHHWWDREDGFLLTGSDVIIATNPTVKGVVHQRLPRLENRLYHIPIGTNVPAVQTNGANIRNLVQERYGWPDDAVVVAFFGFLHPVKGLETLLPAFQQVVAKEPAARLLLIGGVESLALRGKEATNYWNELQARVEKLGLQDQVVMTGYLPQKSVSEHLRAADLGVLPFKDGTTLKSGSLLTLWAHQLPTIVTRSETPEAAWPEDVPVAKVPPKNVEALAGALLELMGNPEEQQRLGAAGQKYVRRFSWEDIARQHLEVYRAIVSDHSAIRAERR